MKENLSLSILTRKVGFGLEKVWFAYLQLQKKDHWKINTVTAFDWRSLICRTFRESALSVEERRPHNN